MFFKQEREALTQTRTGALALFETQGLTDSKPSRLNSLREFFSEVRHAKNLMFQEREILVFAAIQWITIAIAFILFAQSFEWIPPDFLEKSANGQENKAGETAQGLLYLLWGIPIMITASYPIALMNACIVSCHYLKASGEQSTFMKCYLLAHNNLGRLWSFTAIDTLIRNRKQDSNRAELTTFIWNIATIGFVPALVSGKTFMESGRDSLAILKAHPVKAMGLNLGYKLSKIIVFLLALLSFAFMIVAIIEIPTKTNAHALLGFSLVGVGIMMILFFVFIYMILRPLYLLAVAKLYTDTIPLNKESVHFQRFSIPLAASFLTLFLGLSSVAIFADDAAMKERVSKLTLDFMSEKKAKENPVTTPEQKDEQP